ncbi:MAG: hypothetical protein L3K16_08245 [Thermoplasmata archaeon]|nr:hypothetical protein [Thermoplasmata archaeon]
MREWLRDERLRTYYDQWVGSEVPEHVGCVAVLDGEQGGTSDDGTLPRVGEISEFVRPHPGGVSAGGDALSHYRSPGNVPEHLEYESRFDRQPRAGSRFLCPHDLRSVPAECADEILGELGSAHSHVVLSSSHEPGARLSQLFLFSPVSALPVAFDESLGWAVRRELVDAGGSEHELQITSGGEVVVRDWSARAIFDW